MGNESNVSTSHSKIFNYWKDKCIDKFGNVYENTPEHFDNTIEVVYDWGEPQCWCCNRIIPVEEDPKYEEWINDESDKGLQKIWNCKISRHYLQRAHIKPKMLGGEDKPENLFLLCGECHKNSPDLSNPKMFLSYIYDCRTSNRYFGNQFPWIVALQEAQETLRRVYGIKIGVFDDINSTIKIGYQSGSISESSRVYSLIATALSNKTELRSDLEDMFKKYIYSKIQELKDSINTEKDDTSKALLSSKLSIYEEILCSYETFKSIEKA